MNKVLNYIKVNKVALFFHLVSFLIFREFVLFTIQILKYGINIITFRYTILFYWAIAILASYLLLYVLKKKNKGIVIAILTFSVMMLGVETLLKFGLKTKQTYLEQKGGGMYQSPYRQRVYWPTKDNTQDEESTFCYEINSSRMETCSEFSFEHVYNNEGIRDVDLSIEQKDNDIRIFCLGDSFTEGIGATQDSSWVELLEDKFNEAYPDKNFNCVNGGVAGSDPIDNYFLLQRLLKYNPELVLLAINNTEINDIVLRGGFERGKDGKSNSKYGPVWEPLFAFSYIFRHIILDVFKYNYELKTAPQMEREIAEAYEILKSSILEIANSARTHNAGFKLIYIPTEYEVQTKDIRMYSFLKHLAVDVGLQVIFPMNCFDEYMFENGRYLNKFYWDIDRHLNGRGYNILSQCVFNSIENFEN